ncbi:MAG: sensor histidine kinase [Longimicrobiales bacterium]
MRARRLFERRLFAWLFGLAVVPALIVLLTAMWVGSRALELTGTLGPWEDVARSGRTLLAAIDTTTVPAVVAEAAARHFGELSESLVLARRWSFLGQRALDLLPAFLFLLALLIAALAVAVSRRLARGLVAPIRELVAWADALGREEPLPDVPADPHEFQEVRVLRQALRGAAADRLVARARALEAERVRVWGEMARRVAHEMKNPLTPLRLAAFRLSRAGPAAELRETVAVIEEETSRLEELAAAFAELGRPAGEGPPSEIDLRELLSALFASDVGAGVETAVESEADLPHAYAHYPAVQRAFRNLVRNAAEAVREAAPDGGGRIRAELSRVDGGAWIEVRLVDNGRGIPEPLLERVFDPDVTTKSGGTGLGLAIVRQAVRAAGGTVQARNTAEGGAEFCVRLPAAPAARAALR